MDTRKILSELRAERSRIDGAIAALEALNSTATRRGRPAAAAEPRQTRRGRRRHMSAAARKRISEMMKQRWAERKKKSKA